MINAAWSLRLNDIDSGTRPVTAGDLQILAAAATVAAAVAAGGSAQSEDRLHENEATQETNMEACSINQSITIKAYSNKLTQHSPHCQRFAVPPPSP
eukprot:14596-Heterococcus_DN1.PRE.3